MPLKDKRLLIGIAYAELLVIGLFAAMLGIAWPSIRADFDLPLEALGLLLSANMASHLVVSFAAGRLISSLGSGRFLLVSSLTAMVGVFAYSLAPSWGWLIVASMVAGAGTGAADAGLNVYFALNFSARLVNWLHVNFGLGATIGPVFMTALFNSAPLLMNSAPLLGQRQPWQVAYLVVGGLFAALTLCFWLTRRRWQLPAGDIATAAVPSTRLRQTLRLRRAWFSIALFFIYTGIETTAGQWSYTLLTEGRGVEAVNAGIWLSLYWAGLGVGRLLFGFVADLPGGNRWGAARLLLVCMVVVLVSSALITLPGWPLINLMGLTLMGLALAPIFPTLIAMTPHWLGREHAANAIGFQVSAASLGYAVLPGIAGLLAARFSLETIGPFLIVNTLVMIWLYQQQL